MGSNSDDVESEANKWFKNLYNGKISVPDLVEKMKDFRVSENQRNKDVYACMILNLFDELKFFHAYPQKELIMTA
jgi:CCR4-NOT transcription complex subunit 1